MGPKRWQDWTNGILGLWMFVSPWVLGVFAVGNAAARTAWILGAAIIVFAGIAVSYGRFGAFLTVSS
jgi:NADPH-dependent 2,4-dienoyl-CoA reductase/sulfur reductase-like enzyme